MTEGARNRAWKDATNGLTHYLGKYLRRYARKARENKNETSMSPCKQHEEVGHIPNPEACQHESSSSPRGEDGAERIGQPMSRRGGRPPVRHIVAPLEVRRHEVVVPPPPVRIRRRLRRTIQQAQRARHRIAKALEMKAAKRPRADGNPQDQKIGRGLRVRRQSATPQHLVRPLRLGPETETMRREKRKAHSVWKEKQLKRARQRNGESASDDLWDMMQKPPRNDGTAEETARPVRERATLSSRERRSLVSDVRDLMGAGGRWRA